MTTQMTRISNVGITKFVTLAQTTQVFWKEGHLPSYTGCFFYWSALKMTKSQPLKEFSELVLPKKRLRMKKVKVPELVLLYSRNSSNTLIFLVKIYLGLTLRTFPEEQ